MSTALDSDAEVRFTAEEYWRMADVLDLERVDLIDGVLFRMSPEFSKHIRAVVAVFDLLRARYPDKQVLPGGSIELAPDAVWTPDVVVLDAPPDQEFDPCPKASDVLLVVEVAVSSWSRDTGWKLAGYAASHIHQYWVVDPNPGGKIVWYREPARGTYGKAETIPLPDGLASITELTDAHREER